MRTQVKTTLAGYYTTAEAGAVLGLHRDTVRRYIGSGLIKAVQPSGQHTAHMISEAQLREFQRNRRGPGNPNFGRPRRRKRRPQG